MYKNENKNNAYGLNPSSHLLKHSINLLFKHSVSIHKTGCFMDSAGSLCKVIITDRGQP
jgi:hypothetical protein